MQLPELSVPSSQYDNFKLLINDPVGCERDATRRLCSNSHLFLSDVESLADSLSGEVLSPTFSSEGGGLDVSLSSLPHSLTFLWGVEISEHSNVGSSCLKGSSLR